MDRRLGTPAHVIFLVWLKTCHRVRFHVSLTETVIPHILALHVARAFFVVAFTTEHYLTIHSYHLYSSPTSCSTDNQAFIDVIFARGFSLRRSALWLKRHRLQEVEGCVPIVVRLFLHDIDRELTPLKSSLILILVIDQMKRFATSRSSLDPKAPAGTELVQQEVRCVHEGRGTALLCKRPTRIICSSSCVGSWTSTLPARTA